MQQLHLPHGHIGQRFRKADGRRTRVTPSFRRSLCCTCPVQSCMRLRTHPAARLSKQNFPSCWLYFTKKFVHLQNSSASGDARPVRLSHMQALPSDGSCVPVRRPLGGATTQHEHLMSSALCGSGYGRGICSCFLVSKPACFLDSDGEHVVIDIREPACLHAITKAQKSEYITSLIGRLDGNLTDRMFLTLATAEKSSICKCKLHNTSRYYISRSCPLQTAVPPL